VESPVARVLREGRIGGLANHTLLIAKDGTERPIADSGAPIRDDGGAITGVVLVFRDRTEERAAQKAMADVLGRQKALLSAVPDIIMEVDSNRIYTWANGSGMKFFWGRRDRQRGRLLLRGRAGHVRTGPAAVRRRRADRLPRELAEAPGRGEAAPLLVVPGAQDERGEVIGALSTPATSPVKGKRRTRCATARRASAAPSSTPRSASL